MIEKHCTNALNILDRFHVVAKLNLALNEVRASEARRLVQDGYEPVLKKSRWCLLKRRENLTGKQRVKQEESSRVINSSPWPLRSSTNMKGTRKAGTVYFQHCSVVL